MGSNVLVMKPCRAKGKVMGEKKLGGKLPGVMKMLDSFSDSKLFSDVRASEKLKVLTAVCGEKKIFVFSHGLIRVRNADSKADLEETVRIAERIIFSGR